MKTIISKSKISHQSQQKKILFFTSKHCVKCPQLKVLLIKNKILFTEVSVDTNDGSKLACSYRVASLPSLFDQTTFTLLSGVCSIEHIRKTFKI